MKLALSITLAIAVLYLTIWPHELGHSVAAYSFGCKADPWSTDMSWFLWDSWAGDVDYDCVEARGPAALMITDGAGVAVNLLLLGLALLIGRWSGYTAQAETAWRKWLYLGVFWWALANYTEAFSYLVINTLWLSSDMQTVVLAAGGNRWPWFAAGLAGAIVIAHALRRSAATAEAILAGAGLPARLTRFVFPVYVGVTGLTMALARIVLT